MKTGRYGRLSRMDLDATLLAAFWFALGFLAGVAVTTFLLKEPPPPTDYSD